MTCIERTQCVIAHTRDLEPLYTFKKFPVFMGCTVQPEARDIAADMAWCISRSSGLVQLRSLIPLDVLYPESHGAGCVGGLWDDHHQAFARFIRQYRPASVFEIGGAHGILATKYCALEPIPWTIIEPNPAPVDGCTARFIKGFFDNTFRYTDPLEAVVHSHVFEHIYEPDVFMSHLSGFVPAGKSLLFSVPRMQVMLERNYTNCINLEHTVFLTEPYIEYLLAKHGFRMLKREYFMEDHSIFYRAVRDEQVRAVDLPSGLYERNWQLYMGYLHYHEELIRTLNERLRSAQGAVYLFGAHVFAQYLLAFGLDASRIRGILDNDPRKQGKRLYGTSLQVQSPRVLKSIPTPAVILKAGVYNDEIKRDILNNINDRVEFWE